jgi:hypothetical protein
MAALMISTVNVGIAISLEETFWHAFVGRRESHAVSDVLHRWGAASRATPRPVHDIREYR